VDWADFHASGLRTLDASAAVFLAKRRKALEIDGPWAGDCGYCTVRVQCRKWGKKMKPILLVGSLFNMQGVTSERILDAANALLIDRGYSAFSYADIAETVKIRKASIHHHFPTKAGLVVAVLRRHRSRIQGGMKALDEQTENPLTRIKNYLKFWEGCIEGRTLSFCIGALLGAEMPSLPEDVQAEVRLHFAMLTEWFERTLKAGSKARAIQLQGTVAIEAQRLIAVLHGAMLSARATDNCDLFRVLVHAELSRISPAKS
jgi:TetR/AcrR family transcriptional repressor of nem operon